MRDGIEAKQCVGPDGLERFVLVRSVERREKKRAMRERFGPAVHRRPQQRITGNPDPAHISTRYIERQNLTMRMSIRHFPRLTNAFSEKVDNRKAAPVLYFMHQNFARIHKTLRVTPAMEAGISDRDRLQ